MPLKWTTGAANSGVGEHLYRCCLRPAAVLGATGVTVVLVAQSESWSHDAGALDSGGMWRCGRRGRPGTLGAARLRTPPRWTPGRSDAATARFLIRMRLATGFTILLLPPRLTLLTLLTLCKADLLLSPSLTVPSVILASECNPARDAGAAVPAPTGRVGGGWGHGVGGGGGESV